MANATRNDAAPIVPVYTVTLELDKEEAAYLRTLLYKYVAGDVVSFNKPLGRIHRALAEAKVASANPVVRRPDHNPPYAVLDLPDDGPNYTYYDGYYE